MVKQQENMDQKHQILAKLFLYICFENLSDSRSSKLHNLFVVYSCEQYMQKWPGPPLA